MIYLLYQLGCVRTADVISKLNNLSFPKLNVSDEMAMQTIRVGDKRYPNFDLILQV